MRFYSFAENKCALSQWNFTTVITDVSKDTVITADFGKFFKSKLLFLKYIWFLIQNVLKTWKMKNEKNKVKTTYNYLQRKYCK